MVTPFIQQLYEADDSTPPVNHDELAKLRRLSSGGNDARGEVFEQSWSDISHCEGSKTAIASAPAPLKKTKNESFAWSETKWYADCSHCNHTNEVDAESGVSGSSFEHTCANCKQTFSARR